jgi:hypothetical protein
MIQSANIKPLSARFPDSFTPDIETWIEIAKLSPAAQEAIAKGSPEEMDGYLYFLVDWIKCEWAVGTDLWQIPIWDMEFSSLEDLIEEIILERQNR